MTTDRIPPPDGPPRQPVPPHPGDARGPAPPPAPLPTLFPRQMRGASRQPSCGRVRRMRMNGAHGRQPPSVPHPEREPPHPRKAGHPQGPLPVWRPALRLRAGELSGRRSQAQPPGCLHGDDGQRFFSGRRQVRAAWPVRTGSPEGPPGPRRCRRQRSAAPLPPAACPPRSGGPCPARTPFSARRSASGKMPALPPAVPGDGPPGPSRQGHRPAARGPPSRPSCPVATETAQDRRPPAAKGPWP